MPPHFFHGGHKINQIVYLDVHRNVVVLWMKEVAAGRQCLFQQDSGPVHNVKESPGLSFYC